MIFFKELYNFKKLVTISEWFAFVKENGYKRKEFWSSKGWNWCKRIM